MTAQKSAKKYFEGVGRRKNAVARVRVTEGGKDSKVTINEQEAKDFLDTEELQDIVTSPLRATGVEGGVDVSVKIRGGGIKGQAEAIRLGLARALVKYNGDFHQALRDLDYLRRDPRQKERKKAGLKKARRAPQWQKR